MPSNLKAAFLIAVATAFIPACSKKQDSAPIPPPVVVNVAPVQPAPPPPHVPTPAAVPVATYDGNWTGDSGENMPISFTIAGNQVTSLNASYAGRAGSCSFSGSFSSEGPSTIQDKAFTAKGKSPRDPIEFTATGILTSNSEASGTLVWKGNSNLCGPFDLNLKWTAKKEVAAPPPIETEE